MNRSSERARTVAAILCAALLVQATPRVARAEPTAADLASARDFMKDGKELRAKGDHAGALRKFLAAYGAVPTPITGLAVAEEQTALGQLVEARETLGAIARMPPAPNETDVGRKAREDASAMLVQLLPRIPAVEVHVLGAPAGQPITLTIDGHPVQVLSAEQGWLVNPGAHTVVASTVGRADRVEKIELKERERRKVELVFPAADVATKSPLVTPTAASTQPDAPAVPAPTGSGRSTQTWVGVAVGATGVVALGIGTLVYLGGRSKYDDAVAPCTLGPSGTECSADQKPTIDALADDASKQKGLGAVLIGAGALAVVGGVVLYLTAPSAAAEPRTSSAPRVRMGVGLGGFVLSGQF